MKCFYHPEVDAVATCSNCGRAICQTDAVNVTGKIICQKCLATNKANRISPQIAAKPTNTLAIISIGLGVLGIVGCFCFPIFGSVFGIIAAVTGYLARKQIATAPVSQQGMELATIGMALGVVEALLGIIAFLCIGGVYGAGFMASILEQFQQQLR